MQFFMLRYSKFSFSCIKNRPLAGSGLRSPTGEPTDTEAHACTLNSAPSPPTALVSIELEAEVTAMVLLKPILPTGYALLDRSCLVSLKAASMTAIRL